eukprot:scaffold67026_cov52-Attheya_sp.AAC.2
MAFSNDSVSVGGLKIDFIIPGNTMWAPNLEKGKMQVHIQNERVCEKLCQCTKIWMASYSE